MTSQSCDIIEEKLSYKEIIELIACYMWGLLSETFL